MFDFNNTDQVCVDFFENHHEYVEQNGIKQLTPQTQRIYKRGEEIINQIADY